MKGWNLNCPWQVEGRVALLQELKQQEQDLVSAKAGVSVVGGTS